MTTATDVVADSIAPLLHSIPGACRRTNLSRSTIYRAMGTGALSSVKVGSRRLIPEASLRAFVDGLVAEGVAADVDSP